MNFIDRIFCFVLGHSWKPAEGRRVWRCPLCESRTTDLEIMNRWWAEHGTSSMPIRTPAPARRMWRHTH